MNLIELCSCGYTFNKGEKSNEPKEKKKGILNPTKCCKDGNGEVKLIISIWNTYKKSFLDEAYETKQNKKTQNQKIVWVDI